MNKKKVLALFMAGMLGVSSSIVSAQLESRVTIVDDYCYHATIANCDFYAESQLYATNSFLGTTTWLGAGEYVEVEARTLVASADMDELQYTNDYKIIGATETARVTEADMQNFELYQMIGVDFWHYYQISGDEQRLKYEARLEYSH